MKTGILTFHAGFNHGAFLQTYALQSTLLKQGVATQVLNYQGLRQFVVEYRYALVANNPSLLRARIGRVRKFQTARKQLFMTPRMFAIRENRLKNFNVMVFGSDEIWNLENCVFGHDATYFGQGIPVMKKISYAPSFGSTPAGTALPENIKELLRSFRHISVRDQNSLEIIKHNLNLTPPVVPDPTFLHDIFQDAAPCDAHGYVLVYALDLSPSLVEKIRAYAKARGKRVLSVGYRNAWADENVVNLSPFELLGYYQNADFVFTDMFHGTIFSVLANKNFILQISGYRTNKFHPMLDVLHVRDRVFDGGNADALLADEIDYRRINIKVREFKKTGLRFLAEALGGDE